MLSGDAIAVGATARALALTIFRPPFPASLRILAPPARFVTAGLLPPRIRDQYGYRWSSARERALAALACALRRALPGIPPLIRVVPHARAAERQLARPGRRTSLALRRREHS